MGNRIKKDSIFIIAETLTDSSAFKAGETIGNYKDDNRWITKDSTGKKWQNRYIIFYHPDCGSRKYKTTDSTLRER